MDEISVLDYLKFKIHPKNWGKEILPVDNEWQGEFSNVSDTQAKVGVLTTIAEFLSVHITQEKTLSFSFLSPIFVLSGTMLALVAQIIMEPTIYEYGRTPSVGCISYALSTVCFLLAFLVGPKKSFSILLQDKPTRSIWGDIKYKPFSNLLRYDWLICSLICLLTAFILFGNNRFTFLNLSFWLLAILFAFVAFSDIPQNESLVFYLRNKLSASWQKFTGMRPHYALHFSFWNLLCVAVFMVAAFFRFYQLDNVPLDMFSDQAEKLYDVMDVLDGESPIFFTRNTGREAFQFYWTVLMIKLFGTGISFLSLKIGTALAGLFILPFVYKLGKMAGNRWVGLIAMLLCGVAYWPNVIGRVALRFAFYPMFTAPALYFLFKGLMRRDRLALIWSGIFLGLGLQGYSSMRIVPLAFVLLFLCYLFISVPRSLRKNAICAFLVLVFFAILLALPLLRVMIDMPEAVIYRSMTRIGEAETSFSQSPLVIFLSNFWKAIVMPFWDNGRVWVHSITGRPALDHLSGSFYFIGIVLLILRIIKHHKWEDLCLLLSVPLLLMPSILSLAFPDENPCLNRTGGALIPIMIIAAYGFCSIFDCLLRMLREHVWGVILTSFVALIILINICGHNFDLVFVQYRSEYQKNAWNTNQIGNVIKGFADSIGSYEDAYVIPNAHWVDTRLVGINAGDPRRDYALDKSLIKGLPKTEMARMFIYRDSDAETRELLHEQYPDGYEMLNFGPSNGKNFYTYTLMGIW